MKNNYTPWNLNIHDYPKGGTVSEKIFFLLQFAILAPSGHNSQPWLYRVSGNTLELDIDQKQILPEADPNNHLLLISIGCFIENLMIAARYFHFEVAATYNISSKHIAHFKFKESNSDNTDTDNLIAEITKRTTNRNKHLETPLSSLFISAIEEQGGMNCNVIINTEREELEKIGTIAVEAAIEEMSSKEFRSELSRYVRNNLTNKKFGIPAFGLGIPTLISFFVPKLIKRVNLNKLGKKQDIEIFTEWTNAVGIICTKSDKKEDWIESGRVLERIALLASKHHAAIAIYGSPILLTGRREQLKHEIKSDAFPQVVFRIGHPDKPTKHSPRHAVSEKLS